MPPPPASQMPVRSRLGAGGPAGAGPPARPGGACGKPALFHLLFCANAIVDKSAMATVSNVKRFIFTPVPGKSKVKLGSESQQPPAENLDRVLPRRAVRHV